jgi:hypothetical protein
VVDAHGIPLAVLVSAANVHDSKMMLATVDAIEPIRAAGPVADRTSSMPTRVTTTVTSVWPGACAASSPHRPLWCRAQDDVASSSYPVFKGPATL